MLMLTLAIPISRGGTAVAHVEEGEGGGGDLGRMADLKLVDKRVKELVELKLQVLA